MIRILIAGEGANELGRWLRSDRPPNDDEPTRGPGVIGAVLDKVHPGGTIVVSSLAWKHIHKLRPNSPGSGDTKSVHILAMRARELGCNALIFTRDRDGDRRREKDIRNAVEDEAGRNQTLRIAAGVPIEMLESWLLAFVGIENTEGLADPVATLSDKRARRPKRKAPMVS